MRNLGISGMSTLMKQWSRYFSGVAVRTTYFTTRLTARLGRLFEKSKLKLSGCRKRLTTILREPYSRQQRYDDCVSAINVKLIRILELIESVQPSLLTSHEEYEGALQELVSLYSQDPGVVNRGRLEYLEVLVHHYEHKH